MRRRSRSELGSRRPPDPLLDRILSVTSLPFSPLELDDRRRFDPAGPLRPAYSVYRADRRLIAKSSAVGSPRNDTLSARVGFAVPKRVAVCVRRQQRKEVIHALGKQGGGGSRRRRRTVFSDIDCK